MVYWSTQRLDFHAFNTSACELLVVLCCVSSGSIAAEESRMKALYKRDI